MTFYIPALERSLTRFAQVVTPVVRLLTRAVAWAKSSVSAVLSRPIFNMQNTNISMSSVRAQPGDERSSELQPTPNQPTSNQDRWRQSFTLILAITQVLAPGLAIVAKLGTPVGEVSNKFFSAVTPAGYAFAIWGLIYSTCVAYGVIRRCQHSEITNFCAG